MSSLNDISSQLQVQKKLNKNYHNRPESPLLVKKQDKATVLAKTIAMGDMISTKIGLSVLETQVKKH